MFYIRVIEKDILADHIDLLKQYLHNYSHQFP